MTRSLALSFFLILGFSSFAQAAGQLPAEWYQLPEDTQGASTNHLRSKPDSEQDLSSLLAKTYLTNQETFDALPEYSQDLNRWHLGSFSTELGVTASGLFGILGIKGTANVMLFWTKKPRSTFFSLLTGKSEQPSLDVANPESTRDEGTSSSSTMTFGVQATDSNEALQQELEPIVQIAQSKGVRNPGLLRKNLLRTAFEFQDLTRGIENAPQAKWLVKAFRFDFTIAASGRLMPVTSLPVSVGGELRFRFEWHKKANTLNAFSPAPRSKPAISLAKWLASMQSCLDHLSTGITGFHTTAFQFGIGLSADATIGLAKGSASAIGIVKFALNPAWRDGVSISSTPLAFNKADEMLIIESNPNLAHLEYAKKNSIPFDFSTLDSHLPIHSAYSLASYRVKLGDIEKGLTKAVRIAGFFANPTHKLRHGRWKVSEIKASFDLSIGGSLGLVTLGGIGTVGLDFLAN